MTDCIVHSPGTVILLGGGEVAPDDLDAALAFGETIVAADSGAQVAVAAGRVPAAVIGDMDSLDPKVRAALPGVILHEISEQDSTDFDKCLRAIEAPLILGVGFLGARMDHHLAAQNTLAVQAHRRCLLLGARDICFLCPPELEMTLPVGMRFSLFPMGAVEGRSEGLEWPIRGLSFAPDGRVGTSNRVTGPVRLAFDAPKMLVILPRAALAEAIRSLAAQPARWPAP